MGYPAQVRILNDRVSEYSAKQTVGRTGCLRPLTLALRKPSQSSRLGLKPMGPALLILALHIYIFHLADEVNFVVVLKPTVRIGI